MSAISNDDDFTIKEIKRFASDFNIIVLPNVCYRGCFFCWFRQGFVTSTERILFSKYKFISPSDVSQFFKLLNLEKHIEFMAGDFFDYPNIYDIITKLMDFINSKNKETTVFIVSTGADFDLSKLDLLKSYSNFKLKLSVLTFDTDFKNKIMSGGWTEKNTNTIKKLISSGLVSDIVLWNFGSINGLKKDLEILRFCLKGIPKENVKLILTHPSAPKTANLITKKYNELAIKNYDVAVNIFRSYFRDYPTLLYAGVRDVSLKCFSGFPQVNQMKENFSTRISEAINFLNEKKIDLFTVGFIVNDSFFNFAIKKFTNLKWIKVASHFFGGDAVSSSFLVFEDIEKSITANNKSEYYIMPKEILVYKNGKADFSGKKIKDFENATSSKAFFF